MKNVPGASKDFICPRGTCRADGACARKHVPMTRREIAERAERRRKREDAAVRKAARVLAERRKTAEEA